MSYLNSEAKRLLDFAEGTRGDFHEPDEQGIKLAGVVGTCLDNAIGDSITGEALTGGYQEAVVLVQRNGKSYAFNLATLFALAKAGAKQLTRYVVPDEERERVTTFLSKNEVTG